MSILRLAASAYAALRAHGEEAWPEESCGALLGSRTPEGWRVKAAVRAENVRTDAARSRYAIAAAELVKMAREARERGLEIAGFYHSHPDHPAQWSATDLAEAHWVGCSYVITEVAEGRAGVTRSFRLGGSSEEDKRFEAEAIEVVEEG